jgi:hypothetical protein
VTSRLGAGKPLTFLQCIISDITVAAVKAATELIYNGANACTMADTCTLYVHPCSNRAYVEMEQFISNRYSHTHVEIHTRGRDIERHRKSS